MRIYDINVFFFLSQEPDMDEEAADDTKSSNNNNGEADQEMEVEGFSNASYGKKEQIAVTVIKG